MLFVCTTVAEQYEEFASYKLVSIIVIIYKLHYSYRMNDECLLTEIVELQKHLPLCFDIPLFQTLAKLVDGWKKHESEKVAIINQLKVERENAEQSQQRQQEVTVSQVTFSGNNVTLAISNGIFYLLVNFHVSDVVAV